MARKKRRFEQLQAAAATPKEKVIYTNPVQQQVSERLEDLGKQLEGKGRTVLYGLGALVVVAILVFVFMKWNRSSSGAAQLALGKAIETSTARVTDTDPPAGSTTKTFKTEKDRAEAAIAEFQAVIDKFGGDAGEKAKYLIALSRLDIDRPAGITELEKISATNSQLGKMAKFALAQTRFNDKRYDEAAALLSELANASDTVIAKDSINFELARVYEKQEKKKEAADLYFNIAKAASEAKDLDGKAVPLTQTANEAKDKLKQLDPERAKEIPETTPETPGGVPMNLG